ncbi:hypothetical protein MLD38_028390 [Melastoma candidum]|uniref:Uncharacterized protein n=1 Tax=Melastoma candidum TaxID=119954 RepID=A0ACB9N0Y8_9MYRT|nr:hypothetical protein MLD38_028390 [Melastoma candidum]
MGELACVDTSLSPVHHNHRWVGNVESPNGVRFPAFEPTKLISLVIKNPKQIIIPSSRKKNKIVVPRDWNRFSEERPSLGANILLLVGSMDDEGSSGSRDDRKVMDGHDGQPAGTASNSGQKKRGRKAHGDAIVDAMLEIAAASRMRANAILRNEDRFSISKCIKLLDEMHGVDQNIYLHALELFENSTAREIFASLKSDKRLIWLMGKYNASNRH